MAPRTSTRATRSHQAGINKADAEDADQVSNTDIKSISSTTSAKRKRTASSEEAVTNGEHSSTKAKKSKKANAISDNTPKQTETGPKSYWLMKAEQEDREVQTKNGSIINAKFTIDDLRAKDRPEPWDGVRNLVARNNMRSMKLGDFAFFYASGGKGSLKPGITGIMKVVKEHVVDWTMYDEGAYGYAEPKDRGPDDKPKWSLVHVQFVRKLNQPVGLAELKTYCAPGQPLADMQLLRNGRISVSKVSQQEWDFITTELIRDA